MEMSAFCNFSVGDVVNAEASSQFARSGVVDNLARTFTNASAVSFQVFEEVAAELFGQQCDGHVSGTGESRVSYCKTVFEFRFHEVRPLGRSVFNFIGVDDDAQSTETSCGEGSIIVIKRIYDFFENGALVSSQDAFFFHFVEVRNFRGPDNVSKDFAGLTFCSDFSHQFASASGLIVNFNARVSFFEAINDTFDENFFHRGVNNNFFAVFRCFSFLFSFLFAAAATSQQHGSCYHEHHYH